MLVMRPELVGPGGMQCFIKKLVTAIPSVSFPHTDHPDSTALPVLIVRQFNPSQQFSVRCSALLAVHRMVGVLRPEDVRWPSKI